MATGGSSDAMFSFGTNIRVVAEEIVAGMQRINATLDQPLRMNDAELASTTAGLQQLFSRLQSEAQAGMARLRETINAPGFDSATIRDVFRRNIEETFGNVPTLMANELGKASGSVAANAPVQQLGREFGRGYVAAAREAIRAESPDLARSISRERGVAAINRLAANPADFGSSELEQIAALRAQVRAEGMIRRDLSLGPETLARAQSQGYSETYMRDLKARTVKAVKDKDGVTTDQFTPTPATGLLRDVTRDAREGAAAAGRVEAAENRVKQALEAQVRLRARELQLADRQLLAAEKQAAAEMRNNIRREGRQGGPVAGFFNKLSGNTADQSILNNVGGHIANAAQYTFAYGALFAVQGALRDTISEYLDYQDSLTDLQVATRNTGAVTQEWVNDLGEVSRVTGANVGASLDTASRAVRAFGDPMGTSVQQYQEIGSAANDAAAKLARISDKPLPDATGDLLAIGTSYRFQADQLDQVVDAVANAKRTLGGDPAQISQGLASIASSASVAGFDVNQAADVVSLVQGRLDETGLAAATRLTRIFQTTSGTTGKKLGREMGVDTNQTVREQLQDYAKIYNDPGTSKVVKDRITSQLGGQANLRELLALLENGKQLQEAYGESAEKAGGATDEFNRKTKSLAGTITNISGDIKAIQTNLGRTDLGAPFAAAVFAAEPLLELLNRILQAVDEMPNSLKLTIGLVGDLLIASKAISVVSNARSAAAARGGMLNSLTGAGAREAEATSIAAATEARAAAEAAYLAAVQEATAARVAVEAREDTVITEATVARGAAEAGGRAANLAGDVAGGAAASRIGILGGALRLLKFAVNPWTLGVGAAVGAGIGVNSVLDARQQRASYDRIAARTANAYGRNTGTSASLGQVAADFRNAAGQVEKADSNRFSGNQQEDTFHALRTQVKDIEAMQKRVAAEENAAAKIANSSVFGDGGVITSVGQLQAGLEKLGEAGVTARGQLGAVERTLLGLAAPSQGQSYAPEALSSTAATALVGGLRDALPKGGATVYGDPYMPAGGAAANAGGLTPIRPEHGANRDQVYNLLAEDNQVGRIAAAYRKRGRQLGLHKGDTLTTEQTSQLARAAADALDLSSIVDPDVREQIQKRAYLIMLKQLQTPGGRMQQLLNGRGRLSNDQITTLLDPTGGNLEGLHQQAVASVPKTDDGSELVKVNKQYLRLLKSLQRRNGGPGNVGALDDAVQNAEDEYARSAVARMEMLRKHAQNKKGLSKAELRGIGTDWLKHEINASINDTAYLIELMNSADLQVLAVVRASLVRAKRIADAAAASRHTFHSHAQAEVAAGGISGNPAGARGGRTAAQKEADANLDQFDKAASEASPPPSGSNYATGGDAGRGDARKKAEEERKKKKKAADKDTTDHLTAAQQAARLAAARVDPDRTIAVARIALQSARADLAALKPKDRGTDAYYSALKAVHDAKEGLAQAEADHASAVASAQGARIGGGLATARAQIHAAAIGLHQMTKGTTGWWNALGEYYNAQQAMRDAIAAYRANQDRLHGDMTDPVENARDALRAAQRQLRLDRGRGRDVRTADRVAIRENAAGLESARFQQRMSDMQTADELGRISHRKYLQYLDHEHDRLSRIHKRTRQQQDQLDTVDKAMKDAKTAMDSQFNLGDINTNGLVYQVRRFKAENAAQGAQATAGHTTHQTVSISINGADTAKVKTIIDGYLRIQGGQRQALTRRKV